MRTIGVAERALGMMLTRVRSRRAFGKPLAAQGTILKDIADSRIEIDQARLLVLNAAAMIDRAGAKGARREIAAIKVSVFLLFLSSFLCVRLFFRTHSLSGGGFFFFPTLSFQVAIPTMALSVIDRAIQAHGGAGVSSDFPLSKMYALIRTLRIADGMFFLSFFFFFLSLSLFFFSLSELRECLEAYAMEGDMRARDWQVRTRCTGRRSRRLS
jgi:acyl-CoA dehydrogenase